VIAAPRASARSRAAGFAAGMGLFGPFRGGRVLRRTRLDQRADALLDPGQTGMARIAGPAHQVGALNLIEWHGQAGVIEPQLNQLARVARPIRLRPHPLGPHRLNGPDGDDGAGLGQLLLDHLRVRPVRGQGVVPPDAETERAEMLCQSVSLGLTLARIGNE
jgi:hypothetical protein